MSLIQEALRRQQEEQSGAGETPASPARGPSAGTPSAAPVPPRAGGPSLPRLPSAPLPPPPTEHAGPPPSPAAAAASPTLSSDSGGEKSKRPLGSLVGIILVLLLIIGGLVGLGIFANNKLKESRESRALANDAAAQPAENAGGTTEQGGPSLSGTNPTPDTGGDSETPKQPGENTSNVPPSTDVPGTGDNTTVAVTSNSAGTGDTTAEVTPAPAADWPELTLTGVVGKGIRGAATLNGQIVAVGETIEDTEVVYIGDEGVKLEFKSESRYIRVGQKIE